MCEIAKSERRTYRDQDPPRIKETVRSRRSSECDDASGYDGTPDADPDFFGKKQQQHSRRKEPASTSNEATLHRDSDGSPGRNNTSAGPTRLVAHRTTNVDNHRKDYSRESFAINQVPYSSFNAPQHFGKITTPEQVTSNGVKKEEDSCEVLTNGREMAPVMGVPPPPPPAPHMGPDGLILPRKPYNPCLISNNHKDLRRELLFHQKTGRSVLNQKSELQRALEKQRETTLRKEAEKNREETYKDDPRTALQRALEQRARHIQLTEQPQVVEPPNPLVNARAKLRTRTDSQ
ncbi:uncharacterized protein [Venturia canescens]|uniref:uncharacterized protein isoform X2 n=1 Tax=Venturia canescens TaxID=32260 RepID=UPI001C9D5C9D|nr:uncharacterized protein LOC122406302 isoform X2 [Venturia canescens]